MWNSPEVIRITTSHWNIERQVNRNRAWYTLLYSYSASENIYPKRKYHISGDPYTENPHILLHIFSGLLVPKGQRTQSPLPLPAYHPRFHHPFFLFPPTFSSTIIIIFHVSLSIIIILLLNNGQVEEIPRTATFAWSPAFSDPLFLSLVLLLVLLMPTFHLQQSLNSGTWILSTDRPIHFISSQRFQLIQMLGMYSKRW